jgi:hypothetical protein
MDQGINPGKCDKDKTREIVTEIIFSPVDS